MKKLYDCVVIGGGPAGLSAAIYLARFNRSVLVIDKHDGRSSYAQKNENYLGFPSGITARELCMRGRKQAEKYGAQIASDNIISVNNTKEGFVCKSEKASYSSRILILAMGVTDLFPHIGDWQHFVGRSLFWCITCDGHKAINKKILVIGQDDEAASTALQFLNFTKDICFVTNIHKGKETISEIWIRRFKKLNIPYYTQNIVDIKGTRGYIKEIKLENGTKISAELVFNQQGAIPNYELAQKLDLKLTKDKCICVDSEQRTSLPFIYAAGDITSLHSHQIVTAVHEGSMAAQAANYDLYEEYQKT
ncbi:NAD(P)/FAD-dependent oxidoreductase [Candidatus Woesebacteria bacterium]|nr:NAD(P)/FAD-dependent oxidoreductase [Candidatus Woesebacteria bacterium]